MTDADAIRNLLGRYCELIDAGRFAELSELFADAVLTDENGSAWATGAADVRAIWDANTLLHDGSPRTKHLTVNTIIEVDPAGATAEARSSYVVLQATDVLALQPIITGRYLDRFARRDDGTWFFTERRYYIDQVGDLSQHQAHLPG